MSRGQDVTVWIEALGTSPLPPALRDAYGGGPEVLSRRVALLQKTLACHQQRFGPGEVRVFRAPGRINLRGNHVDTHGGCLNLMTHEREVVVVAAPSEDASSNVVNADPAFEELRLDPPIPWENAGSWPAFLASSAGQARRAHWSNSWGSYVEGALVRAGHGQGIRAAVGSDLPHGASLSSSAALCVAMLLAVHGLAGRPLTQEELIIAARDAEWYTGSRCGLADQAAIVLGRRGQVASLAPHPDAPCAGTVRYTHLPPELAVLVADSRTKRSISGKAKLAYTANRFAYSMALEILRQEMDGRGLQVDGRHLSAITPEAVGGDAMVYYLLRDIPERIGLEELQARYNPAGYGAAHAQYFGGLPEAEIPADIGLRGPLLFGLAESERARLFPGALAHGDAPLAGRFMSIGHDGDRVVDASGAPCQRAVDDAMLAQLAAMEMPLALCPGDYGASSPALDGLVDAALGARALGASLTGAGIAGCVLALCDRSRTPDVATGMAEWLASPEYARRTGLPNPEPDSVMENTATAGACELRLG